MELEQVGILQDRIDAALETLTAWNNSAWGIGGAAGDIDREQYEALLQIAWRLESIIEEQGL